MKRVFLLSVLLLIGCMVQAQVSHPRDTINGREVTYFYQHWFDSADCVPAQTRPEVYCNKIFYTIFQLSPFELAKYNYTATPLKIAGVAAAVITDRPPHVGICDSNSNPIEIAETSFENWYEYLRLYKPTDSGLTVLAEKSFNVLDTARCMKIFYNKTVQVEWETHWDTLIHSSIVPVYEVFFEKPVPVTDSFYVGMTANNGVYNSQTHTYPGMLGIPVALGASYLYSNCFPQKLAYYHGSTGYYMYSSPILGWVYDESNLLYCIFPIIDTTGSYRVPDSCKTVMGLEVPYQDSARAYVLWERGRFNSSWEVAYGRADEDPEDYTVVSSDEEGCWLSGLEAGTEYAVRVRGLCFDTTIYSEWSDTVHFVRQGTQGVEEPSPHTHLSPNPARGEVTVASDYALRSIAIYDMQGHKVLDSEAEGFTASLDIAALPQGSYIVVVLTAQGRSTQKLLIER